jgi:hypothetical protein
MKKNVVNKKMLIDSVAVQTDRNPEMVDEVINDFL